MTRRCGPRLLALALLGLAAAACRVPEGMPGKAHVDPDPPRVLAPPAPDVPAHESTAGSLWRGDASRRFLAFENRAKRVGDLVTVLIEESAEAENEATTELDRQSNIQATLDSDVALQTLVTKPIRTLLSLIGFTDQRNDSDPQGPVSVVDAQTSAAYEGEGKLERRASFTTKVACMVTEITPSGLMRLEGTRNLTINEETQIIRLSGFVRPEDVRIDNTVPSTLVASADIEYTGVGVVSDEQRVPWLARVLKLVLPF